MGYSMHLPLLAHHRHWDTGTKQHSVTGVQQYCQLAALHFVSHSNRGTASCSREPGTTQQQQDAQEKEFCLISMDCIRLACTRRCRRGDSRFLK